MTYTFNNDELEKSMRQPYLDVPEGNKIVSWAKRYDWRVWFWGVVWGAVLATLGYYLLNVS